MVASEMAVTAAAPTSVKVVKRKRRGWFLAMEEWSILVSPAVQAAILRIFFARTNY